MSDITRKLHIARSPCYPPYGIIVEDGGKELWDCDCAASTEEQALAAAREQYPGEEVLMWDDPDHYSQRGGRIGLKSTP